MIKTKKKPKTKQKEITVDHMSNFFSMSRSRYSDGKQYVASSIENL